MSRKMVVRVEDLVKWSRADLVGWSGGSMPPVVKTNGVHEPPQNSGDGGGSVMPSNNNELLEVKAEGKENATKHAMNFCKYMSRRKVFSVKPTSFVFYLFLK